MGRSYYTLIASLPGLPPTFETDRSPISRPRLVERLEMLEEEHAKLIRKVRDFLAWDRETLDRTDDEFIARYEEVVPPLTNSAVRTVVNDRMNMRTIASAIRRRRAGKGPGRGVGEFADHVNRHFQDVDFNLGGRFAWIAEFDAAFRAGRLVDAERVLFTEHWSHWSRAAERHHFSFEAVVFYLARWTLVDRWTSHDADRGRERFEALIQDCMGEYAELYS